MKGIYTGPMKVGPNKDRDDSTCNHSINNKLWAIEFDIKDEGKGCAVVKATSIYNAITTLKTNGMHNGKSESYIVTKIEEIIELPLNGLMAEQIITFAEINND